MRLSHKVLAPLAVGAVLLLAGGNAFADVNAEANVQVSKDVRIFEAIGKLKVILIGAVVLERADKAAESLAVLNQVNEDNEACDNCAEKMDKIIDSANFNSGITTVNQAGGNNSNQGTVISVAVDKNGDDPNGGDPIGFAEAQAVVDQENNSNLAESIQIIFRDALMDMSVCGNEGITAVNQATGNMINQGNIVSMAVSAESGVALSEGLLGQDNTDNRAFEFDIFKTAKMIGSVHGNTGVTQVNQSSGSLSNQANLVSVSAALGNL